jgi:glycerol-3-phosphate acyltransferase PlsY
MKGLLPVLAIKARVGIEPSVFTSTSIALGPIDATGNQLAYLTVQMTLVGAVLGHNYSAWMAMIKRHFHRTGKGLATGGGALLGYDWRYFVAVLVVGLTVIALTRYMMAGQVAAAATLPITAVLLRSPDWLFALIMGAVVYAAHHKRFVGMLRGEEPKLYVDDRMGPRG